MKKYGVIFLLGLISLSGIAQPNIVSAKNFHEELPLDKSIDGVWSGKDTARFADSVYIEKESFPHYSDLHESDLELKIKTAWFGSKLYFLFRHFDDELVNGYNIDGSVDEDVADSLVNRDAVAIYFYLSNSAKRVDSIIGPGAVDSIAWLRFVWDTARNTVEGQLPGGKLINSFEEFNTEIVQWKDSVYNWAKLSIDLEGIADTSLFPLDSTFIGFEIELDENDKEIGVPPYEIQGRHYLKVDVGENALEGYSRWSWLWFGINREGLLGLKHHNKRFAAIYPNPATHYLIIQLEDYEQVSYTLFDLMGRAVLLGNFEGYEENVHLAGLSQGTYFLRIKDGEGNLMTQKVIITK